MINRFTLFLLVLSIFSSRIFGVMADRPFMENALPENRAFIDFINISVTNFGNDDHYKLLKDAYNFDYQANLKFLQGEYSAAHRELMKSQEALRDLYYSLLTKVYEPDAMKLLEMSAPVILLAKDRKAAYYLTTGYQHFDKAKDYRIRGYNYNRFLYSNKIRFYREAINHIRTAKKYALLALIESKTPIVDKDDYALQSINEAKGITKREKISLYDKIKYGILNNIQRKNMPDDFPFLLHHDDNYKYIYNGKKSALNQILEESTGTDSTGNGNSTEQPPAGDNSSGASGQDANQ